MQNRLCSSLLSPQSSYPSHKSAGCMQMFVLGHFTRTPRQSIGSPGQVVALSSLTCSSWQSLWPSHTLVSLMQCPLAQANDPLGQMVAPAEDGEPGGLTPICPVTTLVGIPPGGTQSNSSEPSPQSFIWLHLLASTMQRRLTQRK